MLFLGKLKLSFYLVCGQAGKLGLQPNVSESFVINEI